MTTFQKVFLLFTAAYLICKIALLCIMHLITRRVAEKAMEQKHKREQILSARRRRNQEKYRQQYEESRARKRKNKVG